MNKTIEEKTFDLERNKFRFKVVHTIITILAALGLFWFIQIENNRVELANKQTDLSLKKFEIIGNIVEASTPKGLKFNLEMLRFILSPSERDWLTQIEPLLNEKIEELESDATMEHIIDVAEKDFDEMPEGKAKNLQREFINGLKNRKFRNDSIDP